MALNLSSSFTLQMMKILLVMMELILVIALRKGFLQLVIVCLYFTLSKYSNQQAHLYKYSTNHVSLSTFRLSSPQAHIYCNTSVSTIFFYKNNKNTINTATTPTTNPTPNKIFPFSNKLLFDCNRKLFSIYKLSISFM